MILSSQFGCALRHKISFNPDTKRGSLLLWSYFDGFGVATDPLTTGEGSLSEFLAYQAKRSPLFGINHSADIPLGGDNDLWSVLTALVMGKNGKEYSFTNYQDRMVSFSLEKTGKENKDIIIVKISYSKKTGKLLPREVSQLEPLMKEILSDLGYSKQEVVERLERVMTQS
jgi:hypothetical protein